MSSTSSTSSSESEDEDERVRKVLVLTSTVALLQAQHRQATNKRTWRASAYLGEKWVNDLLSGNPNEFYNIFRMSKAVFLQLLHELVQCHGLCGSKRTTSKEVLALTIYIMAHNDSHRSAAVRFQHSTETISRHFNVGVVSLCSLAEAVVKPLDSTYSQIPDEIFGDPRYYPHFKDAIGAIDGTHIKARVPNEEAVSHIGRCGYATQNVLCACDFSMCFTFVMAGWEGTAHDSRLLEHAMRTNRYNFPFPPPGNEYY